MVEYPIRNWPTSSRVFSDLPSDPYNGLSLLSEDYPITINGYQIKNAILLYQALRFKDLDQQNRVLAIQDMSLLETELYDLLPNTRKDWDEVRVEILSFVLHARLFQNWHTFGYLLKKMVLKPIVYISNDEILGAKISTNLLEKEKYLIKGANILGCLISQLRDEFCELQEDMNDEARPITYTLSVPEVVFRGETLEKLCWRIPPGGFDGPQT